MKIINKLKIKRIVATKNSASIIDVNIPATKVISTRPRHIVRPNQLKVVPKRIINMGGRHTRHMLPRRRHNNVNKKESHQKILAIKNVGVGKVLIIIAPGPSSLEVPIERLNNIDNIELMTINKPDKRVWPTKYWLFCDHSQYMRNVEAFDNYNGLLINTMSVAARKSNQILLKSNHTTVFSFDLREGVNIGRSSVFTALQVAWWMNFNYIFIIGCDMTKVVIQTKNGEQELLHSYGKNPDVSPEERVARFKSEAISYDAAVKILGDDAKRFYFCSRYNPFDFPDKYNRIDHMECVDLILEKSNILKRI